MYARVEERGQQQLLLLSGCPNSIFVFFFFFRQGFSLAQNFLNRLVLLAILPALDIPVFRSVEWDSKHMPPPHLACASCPFSPPPLVGNGTQVTMLLLPSPPLLQWEMELRPPGLTHP